MIHVHDLPLTPYRDAWALQEKLQVQVVEGGDEHLILLQHPPVITFGRRPPVHEHVLASEDYLKTLGVDVVHSDRGGDVTFHGPGQLVAYPIIRLNDRKLSVGGYVRRLQDAVVATLADLKISGELDKEAIGIWTRHDDEMKKICALGVRIRRGVSMHGIALNVATDLNYFNLIVPCGLSGRGVTSIEQVLGESAPSMDHVKLVFTRQFMAHFQEKS